MIDYRFEGKKRVGGATIGITASKGRDGLYTIYGGMYDLDAVPTSKLLGSNIKTIDQIKYEAKLFFNLSKIEDIS
ncbi:MAG: hypothetical protein GAK29_00404 [Acinetobacter bereziniae]|uniref:Uncharacterized protein n=1 Tax=Acinetobacter bereziniae TaxID=106648 RepID=A0A833UEX3_ACIBZ|nr:MAG: hypothetical protein GAK29_00404 [Acinetobacter bereziniae]